MSKYLLNEFTIQDIADAIREKNGQSTEYLPSDMPTAITGISNVDFYSPLCFTAVQDNSTIYLTTPTSLNISLMKSLDGIHWSNWSKDSEGTFSTVTLDNGDKLYVRGDNSVMASSASAYSNFVMTGKVKASGTIMSLIDATGKLLSLNGKNFCFYGLFSGCAALIAAPDLPALTLSANCYAYMFYNCTGLIECPLLLATQTMSYCYYSMFAGCSSMQTVSPLNLSASSINNSSYALVSMFSGCSSIKSLPTINIGTNICNSTYSMRSMFMGCGALVDASNLTITGTNTSAYSCNSMFKNCTSLTEPPTINISGTVYGNGFSEMFSGCRSLIDAPSFSGITGGTNGSSFNSMFYGCISLVNAPDLSNVARATGQGTFGGMFSGCVSLVTAPSFSSSITSLSDYACESMFDDCTSLVNPPDLSHVTAAGRAAMRYMFRNCTSLVNAPHLAIVTPGVYTYQQTFDGCSSLTSISVDATSWPIAANVTNFSRGVAASGTFTKPSGTTIPTGTGGIPSGWTVVNV